MQFTNRYKVIIDSEGKMKKIIIALMLLALSVGAYSCGGGAGSVDRPKGENPGTPSVVQLSPSQFVAQTNTVIALHAKVLDGNGKPLANRRVIFTNLSPVGVLSSTTAETGGAGIATVTLKSTTQGFATVQAEVNKDAGQARCRKTVFFSSNSCCQLIPTLTMSVDDGDGTPNEPDDFILLKNANDNQRLITATVSNGLFLITGSMVTFGSDRPYKVGTDPDAACSDGSSTCEVIFPAGNTALTNDFGEASVLVEVVPTALSSIGTTLNILAQADIGAFNLVTLFLEPVFVQSVAVSANPKTVDSGGTSAITANVTTTAGTPAPDGTTVNLSVTQGSGGVDPFAQTTGGVATAQFTAPTLAEGAGNETDTITASVGGQQGSTNVTVTAPEAPPPTPTPDTTSPTVTSTDPGPDGTLDISGGNPVPVKITFSENIDCSTVTPATITITPSAGVNWTVASCSGPNVEFRGTLIGGGTSYTVNIGTGVKDLAGNVAVAYVFSFTTTP
jgi:hypothetical protein